MPEFQKRLKVLEKLNYIKSDKTVLLKGRLFLFLFRVACEINSSGNYLLILFR